VAKKMGSVVTVTVYFLCWAAVHSGLASLRVKHMAERLFGREVTRFYRLGFVLFAIATLAPLVWLLRFVLADVPVYSVPAPWRWLMAGGQVLAAAVLILSVLQTEAMDFVGIDQLRSGGSRSKADSPSGRLQTRGLYAFVRHPMYLSGLFLMWLSPGVSRNSLTLYILMTLYFFIGSIHEERLLAHEFGEQYNEYRKRVPRIIPGLNLSRLLKR